VDYCSTSLVSYLLVGIFIGGTCVGNSQLSGYYINHCMISGACPVCGVPESSEKGQPSYLLMASQVCDLSPQPGTEEGKELHY
jgi:hypothetical protein